MCDMQMYPSTNANTMWGMYLFNVINQCSIKFVAAVAVVVVPVVGVGVGVVCQRVTQG